MGSSGSSLNTGAGALGAFAQGTAGQNADQQEQESQREDAGQESTEFHGRDRGLGVRESREEAGQAETSLR